MKQDSISRRRFLAAAGAGTVIAALGGCQYVVGGSEATRKAREERLADGRLRLPPNQRVLTALRDMGGDEGDPNPADFRLSVHGAVTTPLDISFAELLKMPPVEQTCDVHCVTGWSALDSHWTGVPIAHLAKLAGVKPTARHVIFEAAHGYTSNVLIEEALAPDSLVAYRLEGNPLLMPHGPPARALVPRLYFWKSAKWLTGIRFSEQDEPGFWEVRGYNNHADPWKEERYS